VPIVPRGPRFPQAPRSARALLVLLALAGCAEREPIRIGVAGSFGTPIGAPMLRAAQLAADEINASGGIDGRPIELVTRDDRADPDSAVAVATELAASPVVAVVGHLFSGMSLAAAPVYNGADRPVAAISPSSSAPEYATTGPWTFRVCPSDAVHGEALARWIGDRLELKRGAVLYLDDAYGRGIRAHFVRQFRQRGGTLVGIDPYLGAAPEVGPFLDRLERRGGAQFLVVAGNRADAEVVLREARARGLAVPVLGGDGLEGIEQAGPVAEGTYLTAAYLPAIRSEANSAFVSRYRARFAAEPPPNQPAAATYDAIHLLARVIAEVGPDRERIRDALADIGTASPAFEGVTGPIAFDANGDLAARRVYVGLVRGGTVLLAGTL